MGVTDSCPAVDLSQADEGSLAASAGKVGLCDYDGCSGTRCFQSALLYLSPPYNGCQYRDSSGVDSDYRIDRSLLYLPYPDYFITNLGRCGRVGGCRDGGARGPSEFLQSPGSARTQRIPQIRPRRSCFAYCSALCRQDKVNDFSGTLHLVQCQVCSASNIENYTLSSGDFHF